MPNGTSDPVEAARVNVVLWFPSAEPYLTRAAADLDTLEAALTRQAQQPLLTLLRELEWGSHDGDICPSCWRHKRVGHTPDCRLGNLLKEG